MLLMIGILSIFERKWKTKEVIAGLSQIHMGAFNDLRRNGHQITANDQPASILAATREPKDRNSLACQIGRSMIEGSTGITKGL